MKFCADCGLFKVVSEDCRKCWARKAGGHYCNGDGMTDTKIEPALTAEEWNPKSDDPDVEFTGPRLAAGDAWIEGGSLWFPQTEDGEWMPSNQHGVAALALYGQPFGFDRTDIASLAWAVKRLARMLESGGVEFPASVLELGQLKRIAARIEALLPPE